MPKAIPTVGFLFGVSDWIGGRNYLANLLAALHALPAPRIAPLVITRTSDAGMMSSFFPCTRILGTTLCEKWHPAWIARKLSARLTSRDGLLRHLLLKNDVSILSHFFVDGIGSSTNTPLMGWIADFQHVHLPAFFSEKERRWRDRRFLQICEESRSVILSSNAARADMEAFAPRYADKAKVLQFVASPVWAHAETPVEALRKKYSFDEPYLLIPNQFWAHKNHRLVVSALKILKTRGKRVLILATGSTNDNRNPGYFDEFMQFAERCDVLDRFRILGVIPFEDLSALLFHSMALINPSRFEGWSSTVEEAKAVGKTVLLSDIPVHREQNPEFSFYFNPDDPETLASQMWSVAGDFDQARDRNAREIARTRFPGNRRAFAESYENIVLEGLARGNGRGKG